MTRQEVNELLERLRSSGLDGANSEFAARRLVEMHSRARAELGLIDAVRGGMLAAKWNIERGDVDFALPVKRASR